MGVCQQIPTNFGKSCPDCAWKIFYWLVGGHLKIQNMHLTFLVNISYSILIDSLTAAGTESGGGGWGVGGGGSRTFFCSFKMARINISSFTFQ